MKKVPISILLLAIFAISLAVSLWLHWRIEGLEAEQETLYQQLYSGQIDETFDVTRTSEIYARLHGGHGLYYHRRHSAVVAGVSAFALFCLNVERLKRWLYRKQ